MRSNVIALACLISGIHGRRLQTAATSTHANSPGRVVAFPKLHATDFQHPHDKQVWFPVQLALRMVLQLYEDATFQRNIGSGVKVSQLQYPTIYRLVAEAAACLDMPAPEVFVKQDPWPNAYTLAIQGKRPFIMLHSSVIELLTLAELKAVIGHELGHLKCEHGLVTTVVNILEELHIDDSKFSEYLIKALMFFVSCFATIFNDHLRNFINNSSMVIKLLILYVLSTHLPTLTQWRRGAELTCDRASLLVTQDVNVVMSCLMKLTGGTSKLSAEMSAAEFARQANDYDKAATSSWLGRWMRLKDEGRIYPLPILRAREIQQYALSDDYQELKKCLSRTIQV
mmetsp:Transcript_7342/g.13157  ORF Transcript_7342/g.13157 Transcript_7342/m.13157 type:complete len:341 (-) Transcript_7342:45-1067(-)